MSLHAPLDDPTDRRTAAMAHRSAVLNLLPLAGIFVAAAVYSRNREQAPDVARHGLHAALFQVLTFNGLLLIVGVIGPVSLLAWSTTYDGGDLVIAVLLTLAPFHLLHYGWQAWQGLRAAAAVGRGDPHEYPIVGRLFGRATGRG